MDEIRKLFDENEQRKELVREATNALRRSEERLIEACIEKKIIWALRVDHSRLRRACRA